MDSSAQPNRLAVSSTPSGHTPTIILSIFMLILGIGLGFVTYRYLFPQRQPPQQQMSPPQISETELPIGLKLLKNPLINEWRGAVKGRLIAKDENSITLQDSAGNSITVPHRISAGRHMMTSFFIIQKDGQAVPKSVPLEDIPLGVILHGDFFVVPQDNDKNRIVGGRFVYDERFQE